MEGLESCTGQRCPELALEFSVMADQGPFWNSLENSQDWG